MAAFAEVGNELSLLSNLMSRDLGGKQIVENITVPQPSGVKDELYFHKFVAWAYVALVEAFPVPLRQLSSVLRSTDGAGYKRVAETKEIVQALRTIQSHNLAKRSISNERQQALVEAWFVSNGGTPRSWENCCTSLCAQVLEVLRALHATWQHLTAIAEDRVEFLEKLKIAVDGDWPAHSFDTAVLTAANSIGFVEFDVVAFRQSRIENWRKIAAFFPDRTVAAQAVARAINQELAMIFGHN
jgi:hypothetical protein